MPSPVGPGIAAGSAPNAMQLITGLPRTRRPGVSLMARMNLPVALIV